MPQERESFYDMFALSTSQSESETKDNNEPIKEDSTKEFVVEENGVSKIVDVLGPKGETEEYIPTDGQEETTTTTEQVIDEVKTDGFSYSPIINKLADLGGLEIPEGDLEYEDSEEGFNKLIVDSVQTKASKKAQELFTEQLSKLPEDGKRLFELAKEGVNVKDILALEQNHIDFHNIDMEDEVTQKNLYMDYLMSVADFTEEDAQEQVEIAESTGKLDKFALKAQDHFIKVQEREKANLIQKQKEEHLAKVEEQKKNFELFRTNILGTKEVKGFQLKGDEPEKLFNFFTQPIDKTGKTQWEQAISDPENRKALGYFLMNNFNFKDLEKKVETKKTIELKKNLTRFTDSAAKTGSRKTDNSSYSNKLPDTLGFF